MQLIESLFKALKLEMAYQYSTLISIKGIKRVISEYIGRFTLILAHIEYERVFIYGKILTRQS